MSIVGNVSTSTAVGLSLALPTCCEKASNGHNTNNIITTKHFLIMLQKYKLKVNTAPIQFTKNILIIILFVSLQFV